MTKKIAIIGSGISGLTCGHLLNQKHDITLFEARDRLGGHTHTFKVQDKHHHWQVDTGFIVFNDRTYPNFRRLMAQLQVPSKPTEMSFSVQCPNSGLEYNGHNLDTLFAQRSNLIKLSFWKLIFEIVRFNKLCKGLAHKDDLDTQLTLGHFLAQHDFKQSFSEQYLLPMGAAIWSASISEMHEFPVAFFIRFFNHHGLLNITDRPQWYVIEGGSKQYIEPLTKSFKDKIRLATPIQSVSRNKEGVLITDHSGNQQQFDEVIFACHSDQALKLLADAEPLEQELLSKITYKDNDVVLHRDTSLMPTRRKAWAAWNYRLTQEQDKAAQVSYNMNILQGFADHAPDFIVTLNQSDRIDDSKVIERFTYAHPQFTLPAIQAQAQRDEICGQNHTHFCGAYWYNGFHEDGVRSALDVCKRFGVTL